MSIEGEIVRFAERYQSVVETRNRTDELIQEMFLYIRKQEQTIASQQADLGSYLTLNRDLSTRVQVLEDTNPYVLVLIDGDGLLFNDEYIRAGVEGGRRAAHSLHNAILQKCETDQIEIVAKVCANVNGLSKALLREGSVNNDYDLRNFSIGFSQARASFDFIDIGHGKERADVKIHELIRWHLKNKNCKHMLLGVSHDSGYASFLDHVITDEDTLSLLTIIEGFPTVRELRQKDLNIIRFDHIFRSDKITDRGGQPVITRRGSSPPPPAPPAPLLLPAVAEDPSSHSSSASTSSDAPSTPPSASWATVTKKVPPRPQMTLPLAHMNINNNVARPPSAVITKTSTPAWEPGPRGIDAAIVCNLQVLESIRSRKDSAKLCNNHYLRGPCVKGNECVFEHKYRPSEDEKKAIAFLARQNPCTKGQDCDIANCIYGHHCPTVRDGTCYHPFCKFRVEEHPPGTKFKNIHIKDN
ncbi:hypothetical protein B0T11DRAFT_52397 [Plectosphaerella cucumerina]|uniref:C3H1-type domain-containing protein n=1 Tax=Plectosphaerella cucumerina TaxID=40658 RepID=A0A8K0TIF1_9PEZI|nr:hypothetical protein B0T11DRAFT_52397 [Plectosphaerella cucumerina]